MQPGDVIERYVVEHRVGSGGLADVWAVRHQILGSARALKVLHERGEGLGQRIVEEGQLQARLDHPGILQVLDVLHVDGAPALLLPLVRGPSLADTLASYRPTLGETASLVAHIAEALAAAHAAGVMHRDLKPANVLLAFRGDRVVPRVADFGVAAVIQGGAGPDHAGLFGTPAYAAPEQMGRRPDADHRADWWSLGIMLYELLVGERPFTAKTLARIFREVLYEPVPRLPDRLSAWQGTVDALLNRDVEQRLCNAARLREALDRLAPGHELHLTPIVEHVRGLVGQRPSAEFLPTLTSAVEVAAAQQPARALPTRPPDLQGRERALAALRRHLDQGRRAVTVTGPGGIGKTTVALDFAWENSDRYPGGVYWVDLGGTRDRNAVLQAVAESYRVRLGADSEQQLARVIEEQGRHLFILDNGEQVASDLAELLTAWLGTAPALHCIITSRHRLGFTQETLLPLTPLDTDAAIALFRARAASTGVSQEGEDAALTELIDLLDHLPLAIELAAARARMMGPKRLVEKMGERFRLLRRPSAGGDRHHALEATLEWSWRLLEPAEQSVLAQLSLFVGTFGVEAAESVVSWPEGLWPEEVLERLADKSLLIVQADGRLRLLHSVRAYARGHLGAAEQEAWKRYCTYFSMYGTLDGWYQRSRAGGMDDGRTAAKQREDRVQAARVAREHGWTDLAQAVAVSAWIVLSSLAPLEALDILLRAEPLPDASIEQHALLQIALGDALARSGQPERAILHLEAARAGLAEHPSARAWALRELATAHRQSGRSDRARALLDEAMELVDNDTPRVRSLIVGTQAMAFQDAGQFDEAERLHDMALQDAVLVGDVRLQGTTWMNYGICDGMRGDLLGARTKLETALQCMRRAGDRRAEGVALSNLSRTWILNGEIKEGRRYIEASLARLRQVGDMRMVASSLTALIDVLEQEGQPSRALARAHEMLELTRKAKDSRNEVWAQTYLGRLLVESGDPAGVQHLQTALALAGDAGVIDPAVRALQSLIDFHLGRGERTQATACLTRLDALELPGHHATTREALRSRVHEAQDSAD